MLSNISIHPIISLDKILGGGHVKTSALHVKTSAFESAYFVPRVQQIVSAKSSPQLPITFIHVFTMLVRSDLAVAVILGVLHSTANLCSAEPKITVVTQNLSWLENLVLEPTSNSMFVSELKFGRVWKIQMNSNQSYTRQLWISTNFTRILGLTKNLAVPRVIYGVGSQAGDNNVVFSASTIFPNNFTVIAHTPKGRVGNGFDCHYASGKLYTASEGDFLPGTDIHCTFYGCSDV